MKFNNRENERIALPDGKEVYRVRSTAVVVCIVCWHNNIPHVLMLERGKAVDHSGLWCLPCGYLDWDETLDEAVLREVYEETGLDLTSIPQEQIIHYDRGMPHDINSLPSENRQNIAHIFGIAIKGPLPQLNPTEAIASGEVDSVEWVRLSAIPSNEDLETSAIKNMFAFNHNQRAHNFVELVRSEMILP